MFEKSATDSQWQIIYGQNPPKMQDHQNRPVVAYPPHQTFYVGLPGGHHRELASEFNIPNDGKESHGSINNGKFEVIHSDFPAEQFQSLTQMEERKPGRWLFGKTASWKFANDEQLMTPAYAEGAYKGKPNPWSLGHWGKGMIHNGVGYIWECDHPGESPHHPDVLSAIDKTYNNRDIYQKVEGLYDIDPKGSVTSSDWGPSDVDKFVSMHPDLHAKGEINKSRFATAYEFKPWTPGKSGKFLITPEGKVHHWEISGANKAGETFDGLPSHSHFEKQVLNENIDVDDESYLGVRGYGWISPKGEYSYIGRNDYPWQENAKLIESSIPSLKSQTGELQRFGASDDWLPQFLYHWTEARLAPAISEEGLKKGVYLTTANDPEHEWNPDIPDMIHPLRIIIDTSQLDPDLFGSDEETGEGFAGPPQRTLEASGNLYYNGWISPDAIVSMDKFDAPDEWNVEDIDPESKGYEPI